MKQHHWADIEIKFIKANLHLPDRILAERIGVTKSSIEALRVRKGIVRPKEQWRFQKGHIPANKGQKMSKEMYEKCAPTMFKKGSRPKNYREIGEVFSAYHKPDQLYYFIKLKHNRQYPYGRYLWEQTTGQILSKHEIIQFKDKNPLNCTFENLEKITRQEQVQKHHDIEKCRAAMKHIWKMVKIYEDTGIKHRFGFKSKRKSIAALNEINEQLLDND